MIKSKTLAEALPEEIARCGELLGLYQSLGPVGQFGYTMIKAAVDRAVKAMGSGDVVAMLRSYEELKGCE